MASEIATQIEIDAPPDRVWRTIADAEGYPDWNPFIRRVQGSLATGQSIRFAARMAGVTVKVRADVMAVDPPRELRWAGNLLHDRIARAEHYHICEPGAGERTRFIHGEIFSGVLPTLLWPILRRLARPTYAAFNEALKTRVEEC